jgi:hypothetical protein
MTLRLVTPGNVTPVALSIFDSALDRNGRRQLKGLITLIEVDRGHLFAREGDVGHNFLLITEGIIKLWKALPDGRRQIVPFAVREIPSHCIAVTRPGPSMPKPFQSANVSKFSGKSWNV